MGVYRGINKTEPEDIFFRKMDGKYVNASDDFKKLSFDDAFTYAGRIAAFKEGELVPTMYQYLRESEQIADTIKVLTRTLATYRTMFGRNIEHHIMVDDDPWLIFITVDKSGRSFGYVHRKDRYMSYMYGSSGKSGAVDGIRFVTEYMKTICLVANGDVIRINNEKHHVFYVDDTHMYVDGLGTYHISEFAEQRTRFNCDVEVKLVGNKHFQKIS